MRDLNGLEIYDRQGKPIETWEKFVALKMKNEYRVVKQEEVGPFGISTVWLGYNTHIVAPPLIFETIVFFEGENLFEAQYATEAEAMTSHEVIEKAVKKAFVLYGVDGVKLLLASATFTLAFSEEDE